MTAIFFSIPNSTKAMKQENLLWRSKSTGFLDKLDDEYSGKCFNGRFGCYTGSDNPHASVFSIGACFECDGTESSVEETKRDSGIGKSLLDSELLLILDQKIDKLNELLLEQQNLLISIKQNILSSQAGRDRQLNANKIIIGEDSKNNEEIISTNETMKDEANRGNGSVRDGEVSAAQSLLEAIEMKQDISLDHIMRVALENFLQSDDLKEHVAAATAECVKGVVHGSFCRVLSNTYLPMVERSHRRLVKYVTKLLDDSFANLEEGTASLFKSIHKTSRNIRMSLEKHQNLLEATDTVQNMKLLRTTLKGVLEEELRMWRGRVMQELTSPALWDSSCESEAPDLPHMDYSPMSPMQPANPKTSVIDSLMKCAVINKHVQDGDANGAFEEALSSADLSLVMAACRAADPTTCLLQPAVLLSLLQQLATDMVHDTQLKCRYLEEAILNLENCDAATREHLPLVVGEVRKHLTKFLVSYPKHHASRRIALIVMATNNLLK